MSLSGFVFSFYRGWYLSILLLCAFPMIISIGIFMSYSIKSGFNENMKAYSKSGGFSE